MDFEQYQRLHSIIYAIKERIFKLTQKKNFKLRLKAYSHMRTLLYDVLPKISLNPASFSKMLLVVFPLYNHIDEKFKEFFEIERWYSQDSLYHLAKFLIRVNQMKEVVDDLYHECFQDNRGSRFKQRYIANAVDDVFRACKKLKNSVRGYY